MLTGDEPISNHDDQYLYCGVCDHELNNPVYKICNHPILPVPICILCEEDFNLEGAMNGELCSWCGNDMDELVLCGDEGSVCNHSFCKTCLRCKLSSFDYDNIESQCYWTCLVCNPSPFLDKYTAALELGQKYSIYCSSSLIMGLENGNPDWQKEVELYVAIVEEINHTTVIMDKFDDESSPLYAQIVDEAVQTGVDAFEEIHECKQRWQRHYEILLSQEADAEENLREAGYDVRSIQQQYLGEDSGAAPPDIPEECFSRIDSGRKNRWDKLWTDFTEDDIFATDTANDSMHDNCLQHPFVAKYANENDVPLNRYPQSFNKRVPVCLLKSLYHCHHDGNNELLCRAIAEYKIPPEILIVMKYCKLYCPSEQLAMLPFCRQVHPAVAKVFRESQDRLELLVLCRAYNLDESFAALEEVGEEFDEVCVHNSAKRNQPKHPELRSSRVRQVLETENFMISHASTVPPYWLQDESTHKEVIQVAISAVRCIRESEDAKEYANREKMPRLRLKRKIGEIFHKVLATDNPASASESKDILPTGLHKKLANSGNAEIVDLTEADVDDDVDGIDDVDGGVDKHWRRIPPTRSPVTAQHRTALFWYSSACVGNVEINSSAPRTVPLCSTPFATRTVSDQFSSAIAMQQNKYFRPSDLFTPKQSASSSRTPSKAVYIINDDDDDVDTPAGSMSSRFDAFPAVDGAEINENGLTGEPKIFICVDQFEKLKQHQIEGVRFIWNNIMNASPVNSISTRKKVFHKSKSSNGHIHGNGCIIAHCMGLGKSLLVVSLVTALVCNPSMAYFSKDSNAAVNGSSTNPPLFQSILILCPVNTLQNWEAEFRKWVPEKLKAKLHVSILLSTEELSPRIAKIFKWKRDGGVLVMGYEMFRILCTESTYTRNYGSQASVTFSKVRSSIQSPGPDLVIADEAHIIKDCKAQFSEALSAIRTFRRVALTGSPLQNNLIEYYHMVNWVKPMHLRSLKQFKRVFVMPIESGEHKDASPRAVLTMKKKLHVLYTKVEEIVQRRDITTLAVELPPKREFVVSLRMTDFQMFLYGSFLMYMQEHSAGCSRILFVAFQSLLRLWNHPGVAIRFWLDSLKSQTEPATYANMSRMAANVYRKYQPLISTCEPSSGPFDILTIEPCAEECDQLHDNSEKLLIEENCDESDSVSAISSDLSKEIVDENNLDNCNVLEDEEDKEISLNELDSHLDSENNYTSRDIAATAVDINDDLPEVDGPSQRLFLDWWSSLIQDMPGHQFEGCTESSVDLKVLGNKMVAFLFILTRAVQNNDKVLLFSQSISTLDFIETVLGSSHWGSFVADKLQNLGIFSAWRKGRQYLRIDGKVKFRQELIDSFNKQDSPHKLFIISTKAGNMGINLQAANRIVLFDSNWNPAIDLQAVYRSYRYGQKKSVFVYRLLAAGSMEEKIYKKQIQKQALAARVVDAKMPENQFTRAEKSELLTFNRSNDDNAALNNESISKALAVLNAGTKDDILIEFVQSCSSLITSIEDQGELLMDNEMAHLSEEEQIAAEEENELEERGPQLHATLDIQTATAAAMVDMPLT